MLLGAPVSAGQWWTWNQIPVTLGNILSGAVFTGLALYYTYPVKQVLVAGGSPGVGAGVYQRVVLTPPGLLSISITPAAASISVGSSQRFFATGSFQDGTAQTLASVLWGSANNFIVEIGNDAGSPGIATGLAPGTTAIGTLRLDFFAPSWGAQV